MRNRFAHLAVLRPKQDGVPHLKSNVVQVRSAIRPCTKLCVLDDVGSVTRGPHVILRVEQIPAHGVNEHRVIHQRGNCPGIVSVNMGMI